MGTTTTASSAPPDDTIYIYSEYPNDPDATAEISPIVVHHTTPVTDLTNATQQSTVIDVDARTWETGDPDLFRAFGRYNMLLDNKESGSYHVALAQSDDLYDWSIVVERLTQAADGDPTVTKFGGELRMLSEQSETSDGTAAWRIQPYTYDGLAWVRNRGIQWGFTATAPTALNSAPRGRGAPQSTNQQVSSVWKLARLAGRNRISRSLVTRRLSRDSGAQIGCSWRRLE